MASKLSKFTLYFEYDNTVREERSLLKRRTIKPTRIKRMA